MQRVTGTKPKYSDYHAIAQEINELEGGRYNFSCKLNSISESAIEHTSMLCVRAYVHGVYAQECRRQMCTTLVVATYISIRNIRVSTQL